ncbi:Unc-45 family protein [Phytophthora megakarya]|uniref:Unc-45 family protein n=1 Tax=Phytophthora megakarya TaxID=4795 RepID=A0A225WWP3_9STRA|nr:Unc-45 family protein [Phytophthora megakarya]
MIRHTPNICKRFGSSVGPAFVEWSMVMLHREHELMLHTSTLSIPVNLGIDASADGQFLMDSVSEALASAEAMESKQKKKIKTSRTRKNEAVYFTIAIIRRGDSSRECGVEVFRI